MKAPSPALRPAASTAAPSSAPARPHRPLPRFVLRSPMLPFDALAAWSRAPVEDPRAPLRALVDDPAVREALYVASPELDGSIEAWRREPETVASAAVERALVRYVSRMASRSTPFGLFAAVSVGAVAAATDLALPARAGARRCTRLDNDLLFALCADLGRDPEVRARLRYRPNSSRYHVAGRLRYAEARLAGPVRSYHLVAVDRTSYLDAVLDRAAAGATRDELAAVLCADPDITRDDALGFLDEVIATQVLVPELAPAVTGAEPIAGIIATLEACGLERYAGPLRDARAAMRALDGAPAGVPADAYRAIERALAAALPTKIEPARLFQIDAFKPAPGAALGTAVAQEVADGVALLHAITPAAPDGSWARFRERFVARYETREVPLLEVLDDELGIGFGDGAPETAPLLADLAFPARSGPAHAEVGPRDAHLLRLVADALRAGATEVVLTDDDVAKLREPSPLPLPDVVGAMAVLGAASSEAVAAGDYLVRLTGVARGANLLGRFCHGSPEVLELTRACLRAEEACHPGAVFAEVVHLPEGRLGNVLLRPVLRAYEIPYLGASGADPDRQLAVDDLVVSVAGDRVVLRSRRLGVEVIPRLTTAHNFAARSLPAYRFLCAHALQGVGHAAWSWGLADQMPALPRVRRGRIVLERARWTLGARDLAPLEAALAGAGAAKTPEQVRAIRTRGAAAIAELRARLALPRWIVIGDGDNELPVDLDNELMVDSAAHLLKGRDSVTIFELLPAPDQLCAHGAEGAFAHELVVMLARPAPAPVAAPAPAPPAVPAVPRRFLPGSSWLFLKLYTGRATADRLLRDHLAPAIRAAVGGGLASRWFFLRYGDPEWHLRLRFAGEPRVLTGDLLPFLHEALAPATDGGLLWRLSVDTYEREVERYGGPDAIDAAEDLFWHDSECALSILSHLDGDAGADAAWRLALRGIDTLLSDLGLSTRAKLAAMTAARDGFGAEVGLDTAFQRRLGDKYRTHRAELADLLATPAGTPQRFAPALDAFAERSRRLAPITARLRALEAAGRLHPPLATLADSYVHMHVNRMIRSAARRHEVVLYDLLRRHYDGVLARERAPRAA